MATVIRHKQGALTRVLPHAQNRKYAVPNRKLVQQFVTPVVWLGDSIMAGNTGYQQGDWETPADYTPNLPRLLQYNEAVGGTTLAVIRSSYAADVDAHPDAEAVIFNGGINDLSLDRSLNDMLADAQWIVDQTLSRDLKCMVVGIQPWRPSTGWTAARQVQAQDYNSVMSGYCRNVGAYFCSGWAELLDPAFPAEDGYKNPDYLSTGTGPAVHLNQAGSEVVGKLIERSGYDWVSGGAPALTGGYQFDTNQCFDTSTYTLDQTFDGSIEADMVITDASVNNDFWGVDSALMHTRARSVLDFVVNKNGGATANTINFTENVRFKVLIDFKGVNGTSADVSIDGGPAQNVGAFATTGAASAVQFGGRTGGVGMTGIMYQFTIRDSGGTIIHQWNFNEGSGTTATSDQGEVANLNGPPGAWV